MKAIVFQRYGPAEVLELVDIPEPVPGDDDVLVAIRAASINPLDWHFMTGLPYVARFQFGLSGPKVTRLGADLAGTVEAVGKNVTRFAPGDEVFGGVAGESPEHPLPELGSCAEYVCVPEESIVAKPANVTFEQAAAVSVAALTALQGLRDRGRIQPGQQVLINGASGGVGTFAVQLATWLGAEVTGVCSTRNVDLLRSIGADHVIDYTSDDFTRGAPRFDLILDNIGNRSFAECRRVMTEKAVYVASFGRPENRVLGPAVQLAKMMGVAPFVSQRAVTWVANTNQADLLILRELLESNQVTPVIDRAYPLAEVADAMRYLEMGHTRGKIVVSVTAGP